MSTEKWKQEHAEEMRAYRRKHYHNNKKDYYDNVKKRRLSIKKFIVALKSTLKCSRCPESDSVCLDFHHKNPKEKLFSIAAACKRGWQIEKILEEISKCIILCSNCHRKEHGAL